jgi:hypothetical protein
MLAISKASQYSNPAGIEPLLRRFLGLGVQYDTYDFVYGVDDANPISLNITQSSLSRVDSMIGREQNKPASLGCPWPVVGG